MRSKEMAAQIPGRGHSRKIGDLHWVRPWDRSPLPKHCKKAEVHLLQKRRCVPPGRPALHLTWGPEASRTYRDLFVDDLAARGLPPGAAMVFSGADKEAWARVLGVTLPLEDPFCLHDCAMNKADTCGGR